MKPSVNISSFIADVGSLRNVVATSVGGEPALFFSGLEGDVGCFTVDGRKLWSQASPGRAVMFRIEAADVDGDGQDELLAASADGHITCWGNDGRQRWRFNPRHKVRFSEVAVLRRGADSRIFAGGNDFTLYELDGAGNLVSATPIQGVVRRIEVGNFLETNRPSIFLMTLAHDKFRWRFMGFLDPETKDVLSVLEPGTGPAIFADRLMLTDFDVCDIDGDGRDELLLFGVGDRARFGAIDGEFEEVASFTGSPDHRQRYAHVRGSCLLPSRPEIVLQYGGVLYVCDLQGKLLHTSGERHRGLIYNDFALERTSGQLVAAGQVGGGNGVYLYPLDSPNWWQQKHALKGRLAEVEENLDTLYHQALDFTPPPYQRPSTRPWTMVTSIRPAPEVEALTGSEILFVRQYTWHEDFDRSYLVEALGDDALKRDRRGKYVVRREEILQIARQHEAEGQPFAAWAGHGNDPFYLSIETMEAITEVAPNTCYGFVYAEMSNPEDCRYRYFIDEYVPRLATACRRHGKAKLYFRYKNVFWAASSHEEPWRRLFFSGDYSDILVPSSEDTNSRTQDINFAGRVGMFAAGYVNDVAMRLVDDNPTCWRPHSPGGQRSVSPYLRNGVLLAAYGARSGILFNIGYLEEPGLNILFALMKSGVLPEVEREDILSIGSWHLIQDLDERVVHIIDAGHTMELYTPEDEDAVFSVGAVNWCGASLPEHDFSKQALGVDYRWLNFLPKLPHGMVPVAPVEYGLKLDEEGIPYTVSDCRVGYVDGKPVSARDYGRVLGAALRDGAKRLPVRVTGAAWGAIRLDSTHIRLILVDPGYVDPGDRRVSVGFQNTRPASAVDILTREALSIDGNELRLTVPAGSMRFIDLTYECN